MRITHKENYDVVEVCCKFGATPEEADAKLNNQLKLEFVKAPELKQFDLQYNSFSFTKDGKKVYAASITYVVQVKKAETKTPQVA